MQQLAANVNQIGAKEKNEWVGRRHEGDEKHDRFEKEFNDFKCTHRGCAG